MSRAGRLNLTTLLFYAAPALPLALPTIPAFVLLPTFYAKTVGLGLSATGAALLISRIFDVISDPAIGVFSDRWQTRFGRRKPWMLVGGLVAGIGMLRLFNPPEHPGALYLLIWSAMLYLGWSMVSVAYTAWGAELSENYHERTRITGVREGTSIVGILLAGTVPLIVSARGGGDREGMFAVALCAVVVGAITIALALWRVPERTIEVSARPKPALLDGIRSLFTEGPCLRLLTAWSINGLSAGLSASLLPLYLDQRLKAGQVASAALILIYFASAVAAVPLWVWLSRYGKHRAWCGAMAIACLTFAWVPFLGEGQIYLFGVICVICGAAVGADLALPPAIQADVVDYDEWKSGQRRAGLFFALWGMATKLSLAIAVGVAFPALAYLGFNAVGPNSDLALNAVAFAYGGVPVIFKLIVIALMWNFPIGERRQTAIRRRLDRRAHLAGDAPQRRQT